MLRLVTFAKLKKMVSSFKNRKLDTIDQRLIRGLFMRHIRDFDEELRLQSQKLTLLSRFRIYDQKRIEEEKSKELIS